MRQIKFRGKRLDNGEWVFGYYALEPEDGAVILVSSDEPIHDCKYCLIEVKVDPETVGQYTGLKDKDGVEIWEGDIVEAVGTETVKVCTSYHKSKAGIYNFVVEWDESFASWRFRHPIGSIHVNIGIREYKVIGNIHDNPELLE